MAVGNRYLYFLLAVDLLARDVAAQLWSRLADLKTQHRYAPQTLVATGMGLADKILPDVRRGLAARRLGDRMAETINGTLDRLDTIRVNQSRLNADVAHQVLNAVHAIMLETGVSMQRQRP
jgi:hypothetical protein